MSKPSPEQHKRKYDLARHHAWGGLGFLSVALAIRYILPSVPDKIILPIVIILLLYILFWLFLTYRYLSDLKAGTTSPNFERENEKAEKARLKIEKKRIKAEIKKNKGAGG